MTALTELLRLFPEGVIDNTVVAWLDGTDRFPAVHQDFGDEQIQLQEANLSTGQPTATIRFNFRDSTFLITGTPAFLVARIADVQRGYNMDLGGENALVVMMKQLRLAELAEGTMQGSLKAQKSLIRAHPMLVQANRVGNLESGLTRVYNCISGDRLATELWRTWENTYAVVSVSNDQLKIASRDAQFNHAIRRAVNLREGEKNILRRTWNGKYKHFMKNQFMFELATQAMIDHKVQHGNNDAAWQQIPVGLERIYVFLFALSRNDEEEMTSFLGKIVRRRR
jgi:hypothetical protein